MNMKAPYNHKRLIVAIPVIVLIFAVSVYVYASSQPASPNLKRFSNMSELEEYLKNTSVWPNIYFSKDLDLSNGIALYQATITKEGTTYYSTTNIQVAGVDEADIVKSDGNYLYVISGNIVYIVKAYPPDDGKVVAKIVLERVCSPQLYINGDRLVVIGSCYSVVAFAEKGIALPTTKSFVNVYDISDRSSPVLVREVSVNGSVSGSRMIGDYVYVVSQKSPYLYDYYVKDSKVELPSYVCDGAVKEIRPEEIYYLDSEAQQYSFITVISVNVMDESHPPSDETFLAGASSTMYVSAENMYLVAQRYYAIRITAGTSIASKWKEETLVYRLGLKDGKITVEAGGSVPGYVLNQYSMDEYNGYFRIATTKWTAEGTKNGIYVMNMRMGVVGYLEDIAPGERIYSARFMGDRCYLVTFRQVDPFFVIDLSQPSSPSILGYLKIPGYSSYLHPYDEEHVIGVGKEGSNVKLALFDVSDVSAPKELAKFGLNCAYSDSGALYDPKAFLFDRVRQLVSIPVSWTESKGTWKYLQGAYVFSISPDEGFVLKGVILHQSDQDSGIWRILYIENVLYTVSNSQVCMSDLGTLKLIKTIDLR